MKGRGGEEKVDVGNLYAVIKLSRANKHLLSLSCGIRWQRIDPTRRLTLSKDEEERTKRRLRKKTLRERGEVTGRSGR